ncbi:hypothetical protein Vadar_012189 [Vaccinium darrowii]|uniref:Uncharacterized protein n=1 Tax=Vaccinium darrowii TaxID=229202 RepID=A0ACB7XQ50_9ERIC|nr:hypothetical protein Vadar_012189 [Vaccinium darrowii]
MMSPESVPSAMPHSPPVVEEEEWSQESDDEVEVWSGPSNEEDVIGASFHVSVIAMDMFLIFEKNPTKIKNYGIWLRYQSRTGNHNMYKEYRDTLNGAVEHMYTEMASRHRVRHHCIQIIKTATVPAKLCKRESTKQFHNSKITSCWHSTRSLGGQLGPIKCR